MDLPVLVQMFTDYVNQSNATIANVSAVPGLALEFLEHRRRYFGEQMFVQPVPPLLAETPLPITKDRAFSDEDGVRIKLPQLARDNGLASRYFLAGNLRGDASLLPVGNLARANCAAEGSTLVKVHVRLLLQSAEARLDFFARLYGVATDAAFQRFDIRSCFTEQTENIRLECDPAPSPPPPDNWVKPPSPPVFAFEVVTLTAASTGSALFFVVGFVCCLAVGGRSARARHTSRMIGTKTLRVDGMPYVREEAHKRGELWDGVVANDLKLRGRMLAETSKAADSSSTSGFTFSSLVGKRSGFQSVSTI